MYSTMEESISWETDGNVTTSGMEELTAAMRDMDGLLWRMPANLRRIDGMQHSAEHWYSVNERFRGIVITSKLAASSMTVLLSEYQKVILPSLLSGKVSLNAIQSEVDLLAQNVRSRLEKLESRDQSAMQDLCAEIADLIKTTKEEVMALSNKVKGDTNLVMEQLDGLEENLKHWSTQRKTDLFAVCTSVFTGAFTCAVAAASGALDVESLISAVTSIFAVGRSVVKLVESHTTYRDLKHGRNAARRLKTHQEYYKNGLQVIQPDLDASENMNPSFALRADMIIQLHIMLLNELQKLSTELTQQVGSNSHNLESLTDRYQISESCPVSSLVMMLDLYSKQALFSERTSAPASRIPPVAPTEGRRKRIYNKIMGFTAFQDFLNAESPRTCRV